MTEKDLTHGEASVLITCDIPKKNECLFETRAKQTGVLNPQELVDNLFANILDKINPAETGKLILYIYCKKNLELQDVTKIAELISAKFNDDAKVEIGMKMNKNADETCVKLYGCKNGTTKKEK